MVVERSGTGLSQTIASAAGQEGPLTPYLWCAAFFGSLLLHLGAGAALLPLVNAPREPTTEITFSSASTNEVAFASAATESLEEAARLQAIPVSASSDKEPPIVVERLGPEPIVAGAPPSAAVSLAALLPANSPAESPQSRAVLEPTTASAAEIPAASPDLDAAPATEAILNRDPSESLEALSGGPPIALAPVLLPQATQSAASPVPEAPASSAEPLAALSPTTSLNEGPQGDAVLEPGTAASALLPATPPESGLSSAKEPAPDRDPRKSLEVLAGDPSSRLAPIPLPPSMPPAAFLTSEVQASSAPAANAPLFSRQGSSLAEEAALPPLAPDAAREIVQGSQPADVPLMEFKGPAGHDTAEQLESVAAAAVAGEIAPLAEVPLSGSAPDKAIDASGKPPLRLAAVLPERPAAPPSPWEAAKALAKTYQGGPCFGVMPDETSGVVRLAAFGLTQRAIQRFADGAKTLSESAEVEFSGLAEAQCPGLDLFHSVISRSNFPVRIRLDTPRVPDHGTVFGEIIRPASRSVWLILIDDEGLVETIGRLTPDDSDGRFRFPVNLKKNVAATKQLLMAISSDALPGEARSRRREAAATFFDTLERKLNATGSSADIAIAAFGVDPVVGNH